MKRATTTNGGTDLRHHEEELKRDRVLGITVLVLFAGLLALLFWLSTITGVPTNTHYEYWMLP